MKFLFNISACLFLLVGCGEESKEVEKEGVFEVTAFKNSLDLCLKEEGWSAKHGRGGTGPGTTSKHMMKISKNGEDVYVFFQKVNQNGTEGFNLRFYGDFPSSSQLGGTGPLIERLKKEMPWLEKLAVFEDTFDAIFESALSEQVD